MSCQSSRTRGVFAALLLPSAGVFAQETIDEIVVTADYRGRTVNELPSAITVMTAGQIEQTAIQHFEELIASVPNVNWSGDGHRARYLQIRGIGELEQYEGAPNPSVGFLIDDIDFSGIGTIATLWDIERIEVLRGPQGARYGANALAGLVYVQSTAPQEAFGGQLRVGAGDDNTRLAGLALGGPLGGEAVRYRFSAHHYRADGFRENTYLGRSDTNGRDETTIRGKLAWEPGNWALKLAAIYSDIDDGYDAFAIDNSLTMLSDRPGKDAQRSAGASFKAGWSAAGGWEFTSVTSVADSNILFSFDADWGNENAWAPVTYDYLTESNRDRRTLSQELRFSSTESGRIFGDTTDWLVGIHALQLDDDLVTVNQGEYLDPGVWQDSLNDRFASGFESLNLALFGELEFDVSDSSWLGFGLRVERRSTDYTDSGNLALGPSENMVGGHLGYHVGIGDGSTAYVTLSRGYKAGGFNLGPVPDESQREFGQETLWNLEFGIKSALLDDTLSLNGALFYNKRSDQQVRTSLQLVPGDPTTFVFFTDNAAKASGYGLEADLRWVPSDAWELYGSIGLLRTEFEEFLTLQTGDVELTNLTGRAQAHAPEYTLAVGGTWRHPGGVFARLDVVAKDSFYFDVSHNQRSDAYQVANGRLGYEADRWTVQLWARNIFDRRYAVRGFYFGNEPPAFPNTLYTRQGDPRQYGLTFDWRF